MPITQHSPEESLARAKKRALAEGVQVWSLESGANGRYAITNASSDSTAYEVVVHTGKIICKCRGYVNWGVCKHVGAVLNSLGLEAQTERRYLALDIETSEKGITCAATLASDTGELHRWYTPTNADLPPADNMRRKDVIRFVNFLATMTENGYTFLTWNGLKFDFQILAEESGRFEECRSLALDRHVDMMYQVLCLRGHRLSLQVAAIGMGLPGKLEGMDGEEAALLWALGKRDKVLDYVAQDVKTTLELALRCEKEGFLEWTSQAGSLIRMEVASWLTIPGAQSLPERRTNPLVQRCEHTDWVTFRQGEGKRPWWRFWL